MKTSIVIPVLNQLEFTQQCVESIEAFTPEEHEVIFVDNGSTDGSVTWLRELAAKNPSYTLIRNEKNLGFPTACNQGAAFSRGDYILFLNNDTVVSKEWLGGLVEAIKSAPDIGCVGPMTNCISGHQQVNDPTGYDSLFKYQNYADAYRKAHRGAYTPFWRVVGFCMLVSRKVWDELGGFDERFSPGNFEDDDFCLRACLAGYRNLIVGDVFIHHHGSATCKTMDFQAMLDASLVKFNEKWAGIDKSISAVLIVKDERMNIGNCIANLHGIVDEIIVVDTGSRDGTKAIAKGCGGKVKVFNYKWCDDFSAARNFANSKATKAWILSIDADEVITGLDKLNLYPFHAYRIETRNYNTNPRWTSNNENTGEYPQHEQGLRWFGSTKIRIWPNDKRVNFEYPVHEVVENTVRYLGMQETNAPEVVVHHYGRLCDDYEYGRGDKYWKLLHKQLESGVNDARSLEQIALQAQTMGKFEDARKFWDQVLALSPDDKQALLNKGHCFASEGNWPEALEWTRKANEVNPDSKDVKMNLATCEAMAGSVEKAKDICAELVVKYPLYPLPQGLLNALEIAKNKED